MPKEPSMPRPAARLALTLAGCATVTDAAEP